MKFNNKILGIIFIALLAIVFIKKMADKPEVRSFRDVLVAVDTALVDKIILTKGTENRVELQKQSGKWTVSSNGKSFDATTAAVNGVLSGLVNIKPQQLISKSKEKWPEYELDEATGKKVEVYAGGKLLDSFYAGRFNFNQNTRSAKTYFRKAAEDDVYSVDGLLSMTFDKKVDDFRNKKLFQGISKESVKGIALESKTGNQQINFTNGQWLDQTSTPLDSSKVENYISRLLNSNGSQIDDNFSVSPDKLESKINLLSETNTSLATVEIYNEPEAEKPFVFQSSLNQAAIFRSDSTGLFQSVYTNFMDLF